MLGSVGWSFCSVGGDRSLEERVFGRFWSTGELMERVRWQRMEKWPNLPCSNVVVVCNGPVRRNGMVEVTALHLLLSTRTATPLLISHFHLSPSTTKSRAVSLNQPHAHHFTSPQPPVPLPLSPTTLPSPSAPSSSSTNSRPPLPHQPHPQPPYPLQTFTCAYLPTHSSRPYRAARTLPPSLRRPSPPTRPSSPSPSPPRIVFPQPSPVCALRCAPAGASW